MIRERETSLLNENTIEQLHDLFCKENSSDFSETSGRREFLSLIGQQEVSDKVVADVVEAIIGVYFMVSIA